RLAVDVGSVRIGVASCDPDGMLATPVETVARSRDGRDIGRIAALVDEYEAIEVIIGLPTTLRGEHGAAADAATAFGNRLAGRVPTTHRPSRHGHRSRPVCVPPPVVASVTTDGRSRSDVPGHAPSRRVRCRRAHRSPGRRANRPPTSHRATNRPDTAGCPTT